MNDHDLPHLTLSVLPGRMAVCRLEPRVQFHLAVPPKPLFAQILSEDEQTIVCPEEYQPAGARCEPGWRALRVQGPLAFSELGVLLSIAAPLRQADISLFVLSTYDTDTVLVKESDLAQAVVALQTAGHIVKWQQS